MDDTLYGTRNRRGDWKPSTLSKYPPVFVWARPVKFVKWLFGYPGYILPWNLVYAGISLLLWRYLMPPMALMKTLSWHWIAFLLVENAALVLLFFGASTYGSTSSGRRARASSTTGNGWPPAIAYSCSAIRLSII
ncbi:MAG: hypothetical protein JO122_01955 [Acetobacteraceae bacterium]|nr:hypothetical protein [Acetobacteraceae bacterium]